MRKSATSDEYEELLRYLEYTLHELPAGVLFDHDAANEKQCAELMRITYRLEALAKARGIDLAEFIATCRWHYERYPHYLGRQRHFGSYESYMVRHRAPTRRRASA